MSATIKPAIHEFLLSCEVEGKSYGAIECYSDKLLGIVPLDGEEYIVDQLFPAERKLALK